MPHPLRVALVLRVASVLELLASDILQLHIQTRFCKRQTHCPVSDTHCNYTRIDTAVDENPNTTPPHFYVVQVCTRITLQFGQVLPLKLNSNTNIKSIET